MTYRVHYIIHGEPTFSVPLKTILGELRMGGALKVLTPSQYISDQQRRWWKGVLLPALSKDSGDSVAWWEARLKLAVIPDRFEPKALVGDSGKDTLLRPDFVIIPSINTLSMKQMNELIEGSVQQLHEWGLTWVTLPDETLRR